ncbi:hypothetical protein [Comamonas thiooxydans]|uniref:hypothetical protein n=1 Tax=Comamonas thiooxydans TaxID=363952 RepID=UPI000B415F54|nr:hypothetical protein [Comamonas thiooxydans]
MTTQSIPDNQDVFTTELVAGSIKKHLSSQNGVASGDLYKVPRSKIHILEGYNVREKESPSYKARVQELKQSMINHKGWLATEPMTGYVARGADGQDIFYMTKGHTRLEAYDLAVAEGNEVREIIPAIPIPRGTSMEDLNADLHTSNSGTQLALIELGTVCQRMLINEGRSVDYVAHRLNIKRHQVEDAVFLRTSPKGVQALVIEERVSATTALKALRQYGSGAYDVLMAGVHKANAAGKTKATAKHFDAPSWNRRVVETRLTSFREMQRQHGVDEADVLPADPQQALQFLMEKAYPQFAEDIKALLTPKADAKSTQDTAEGSPETTV